MKTQLLKSPISEVHEIASQRKMKIDFEVVSSTGPPHNRTFITTVTVGEFSASGEGSSKKISKHLASSKVLEELRKLPPLAKSHAASRLYQHGGYGKKTPKDLDPSLNPISLLGQLRQRRKETLPVYTLVGEEGVRNKEFTMQVQVDSHIARGSGANKKEAKKNAAEAMLQLLGIRSTKPSGNDNSSEKTLVNKPFLCVHFSKDASHSYLLC
jgi:double-stranded RNA-binding protein Staufen